MRSGSCLARFPAVPGTQSQRKLGTVPNFSNCCSKTTYRKWGLSPILVEFRRHPRKSGHSPCEAGAALRRAGQDLLHGTAAIRPPLLPGSPSMQTARQRLLFAALVSSSLLAGSTAPAQVVRSAAGDLATVTAARDAFRADLGGGTIAGANGSFGGVAPRDQLGRRPRQRQPAESPALRLLQRHLGARRGLLQQPRQPLRGERQDRQPDRDAGALRRLRSGLRDEVRCLLGAAPLRLDLGSDLRGEVLRPRHQPAGGGLRLRRGLHRRRHRRPLGDRVLRRRRPVARPLRGAGGERRPDLLVPRRLLPRRAGRSPASR